MMPHNLISNRAGAGTRSPLEGREAPVSQIDMIAGPAQGRGVATFLTEVSEDRVVRPNLIGSPFNGRRLRLWAGLSDYPLCNYATAVSCIPIDLSSEWIASG